MSRHGSTLRAKRDADSDDDVDEPAGAERAPEPIRAVGQLDPCPRREACVEGRPRVGVRRAVGQNGHKPTAECDEQRAVRKLDQRKAGRPTALPTPPEMPEREPGLHPRDPSDDLVNIDRTYGHLAQDGQPTRSNCSTATTEM